MEILIRGYALFVYLSGLNGLTPSIPPKRRVGLRCDVWMGHIVLFGYMCGSRGGGGGQGVRTPPLENYKNIWFLSNTGPDPLKITKIPSQHSMLDHHRTTSETPLKVIFGSSIPSSTKKKKKNVFKFGPPLTKLSGSAHGIAQSTWSHPTSQETVDEELVRFWQTANLLVCTIPYRHMSDAPRCRPMLLSMKTVYRDIKESQQHFLLVYTVNTFYLKPGVASCHRSSRDRVHRDQHGVVSTNLHVCLEGAKYV